MKYFYIIANYNKEYAKETEKQIRTYLQERGAVCWSNVPRRTVPETAVPGKRIFRKKLSV